MIWNFGEVYKFIRKSKGLSQSNICSDELSRSTLSKIENNKLMPSFQIMDYLLKQINMTFDEFEYICNRYKPSTRYILIEKISSALNNYKTSNIKKIILECQEYLKVNNDLYIESLIDILMLKEQLSSSHNINQSIEKIAESIWRKLEKSDEWYFFDLTLLNNILFYFPFESVKKLTDRIVNQLEKFSDYKNSNDSQCRLLINLSTIYLYNLDFKGCIDILEKVYSIIKHLNRYDYLSIYWIRKGICQKDSKLVEKGRTLLELVEEKDLLKELEEEIVRFF
ncbi:helix-turn-helix domain-containing protein [Streptococcus equinus]|uniref:helix-turn-helix domain-containing protein n=1 Tax=Streptococcus equinus TaxID=1335 RepID=UPI00051B6E60|nr:Rgg/GadR/MutR family transcriptional regulator [Streptococcus equinus]